MKRKKVVTLILDGWGLSGKDQFNAIDNAKTPNIDRITREYPNTSLKADGVAVGLPEGVSGTSEVNHLTIGSGRIIKQDLPRISDAISDDSFYKNKAILKSIHNAITNKSKLHLVGILSNGGVHSTTEHLYAIFKTLDQQNFKQPIFLHLFTDGRDTPPKSAEKYFLELDNQILKYKNLDIQIGSIQGRAFLDRDRDWAKTEKACDLILKGLGNNFTNWQAVLNFEYNQNNSDEYFGQYIINSNSVITDNDSIIFFHYRTDRLYQIVKFILQSRLKNLEVTTMISISEEFSVNIAFPREPVNNTLAEVISKEGLSQLHITETEKYQHLTFFLNGEKEKELPLEKWELIESNRFIKPYYNLEPSMRNFEISKRIIQSIKDNSYDFIIANLCSPDMVGHTGNYSAAIVSAESIDFCVGQIYNEIKNKLDEYVLIITADHGNSDVMWDYQNNQPHTQHTNSPVPLIVVSKEKYKLDKRESLSDIAPTILDFLNLKKPLEMTGESLLIK